MHCYRKEKTVNTQLLECGHRQPVESGKSAVWCPIHNEMTLVVEPSEPAPAGPAAALALLSR